MKPENIALFKRFLKTEGCNTLFAGMYSQSHDKNAPNDIEEFLRQVDAKDAILSAFHFPDSNKDFGVQYWFEKAVKWEKVLQSATASQFYAYCWHNKEKVQREADKPLSKVDTYLHPRGNKIEEIVRALHTPSQNSKDAEKEDYIKSLQEEARGCVTSSSTEEEPVAKLTTPETRLVVSEEEMALSGFRFFDINKNSQQRLRDGFISINTRNGYRLCFNSTVSEEIIKSGLKHFRIGQKGSEKALFFVFSNDANGFPWRINAKNVCFSNKELIERIVEFFGIKEQYIQLTISKNMAPKKDFLTYKFSLPK